ncbi:DUF2780 domain-containing protein [Pseudomonas sp. GCM10022188]|uniref:DUF2780 domain-containing protein n=1 Tax=Pseudomonas TaxID=286 RepID=UPI001E44B27D|nr:DUF2780 domain-containing protein [Pseudomonas oryzagri]MCC6074955.1 DUF2780 domain-containing protein [Pseudomonas oryzagri]
MPLLRPFSLSALLLAASAPVFAATAGETVQAIAAPAAPALQVTSPVASQPVDSQPADQSASTLPASPAAPTTPIGAAPGTAVSPAQPAGAAALGGLVNPQTLALIDQLRALQVTPQQAVGGIGALLGLAQSRLGAADYAQLNSAVPGLALLGGNPAAAGSAASGGGLLGGLGALSGLLGGGSQAAQPAAPAPVDSLAGVAQSFSVLGMDTSLVGQFGQVLLQFLGSQGLAGALLQSLGGIWGVNPAAPVAGTPVAGTPVIGTPVANSPAS